MTVVPDNPVPDNPVPKRSELQYLSIQLNCQPGMVVSSPCSFELLVQNRKILTEMDLMGQKTLFWIQKLIKNSMVRTEFPKLEYFNVSNDGESKPDEEMKRWIMPMVQQSWGCRSLKAVRLRNLELDSMATWERFFVILDQTKLNELKLTGCNFKYEAMSDRTRRLISARDTYPLNSLEGTSGGVSYQIRI